MAYRFCGKEKLLSLGAYPEVSLKDARAKRDEARTVLASGVDPSEQRKVEKLAKAMTDGHDIREGGDRLSRQTQARGPRGRHSDQERMAVVRWSCRSWALALSAR